MYLTNVGKHTTSRSRDIYVHFGFEVRFSFLFSVWEEEGEVIPRMCCYCCTSRPAASTYLSLTHNYYSSLPQDDEK
jgi:hypothetical protein